jgi:peptidyl-prolyl cis-trans isomerase D
MLAAIRSLTRSPFAVLIIIVPLLAAFALFGVTDVFRVSPTSAATVGGETISARELSTAYQRELRNIQTQNPGVTREQAEQAGLPDRVLGRLIDQAAIEAKADDLRLGVSDEEVRAGIQTIEAFSNPFTGRFDRQAYRQALSNANYSETEFEDSVRGDLMRTQLVLPLLTGLAVPDTMATARLAYEGERRSVDALFLSPALAGDLPAPTDEELQTLIEETPQAFQRPELRRITLARVSPELMMRDIEVAEDDLRNLYEIRLENGELADPATRSLRQWNAPDEATAQSAAAALNAGTDPAEVAAEFGLGEPVELTEVQAYEIPQSAVADAAFEAGANEAVAVEARLGWRVVLIDAANDPQVPGFEQARAGLRAELALDQAEQRVLDKIFELDEARAGGMALDQAGAQAGIPVEYFDFVSQSGVTADGVPVMGLADNEEILAAAFEFPAGFETDPTEYGENGYFVLRVDAVEPARVPDLAEVRERAETLWRFRTVDERLQERADEAMTRLEAGEDLNAIADSFGEGARVETATLRRSETAGPFNQDLVRRAFAAGENEVFEARAGDQRTRAVARVSEIMPPASLEPTDETRTDIAAGLESDLSQLIRTHLLTTYEIERNPTLIDQALGRSNANP